MNRIKVLSLAFTTFVSVLSIDVSAQFAYVQSLSNFPISSFTWEKPQSKVWKYDGKWWCVMPSTSPTPTGSWLYQLNGTTWSPVHRLSAYTNTHADCKVDGNLTYVVLVHATSAELFKLTYSAGDYTSTFLKTINLDTGAETATIDIDSDGIMWLASDGDVGGKIFVRWSSFPYNGTWNGPITLATSSPDPDNDDICAVTAFDSKIGVLWSNQDVTGGEFQFKYHIDGADPNTWSSEEVAESGSQIADDHINFAVDSDGNIYAAIKSTGGNPNIGLLKRNSATGTWDNIYTVDGSTGTRPIVLLNETGGGTITVVYTNSTGTPADIVYRQSPMSSISFGSKHTLISGIYNNATSLKDNYTDEVVILASNTDGSTAASVMAYTTSPTPVELTSFSANLYNNKVVLEWRTETEVNNYGFNIEKQVNNNSWSTIGFIEGHGNSNSPKQYTFDDGDIQQNGTYSYRLKQIDNDGTFEYFSIVKVYIGGPEEYYLSQNYPNPFNPSTTIDYKISENSNVSLKVYDLLGTEIANLVDEYKLAGSYSVSFNPNNLTSGIYIYRLVAGNYVSVRSMSLIK